MTYEETKSLLYKNLDDTLLKELFPELSIKFSKLFEFLFDEIDKAIKDEEVQKLPDKYATDIKSILDSINNLLIFENLDDKRMSLLEAINLLLLNATKLYKFKEESQTALKNNVLINTQYNLRINIEILRSLTKEMRRVTAFKPHSLFLSDMYLETLDKYFELIKDDSSEYGLLDEKIIEKLEKE